MMSTETLVEEFVRADINQADAGFDMAPTSTGALLEKRWGASPPLLDISAAAEDDILSLDDELEVLELPPELGWLAHATSLPGGGTLQEDSMHESLHSGIECTIARSPSRGSGFSRPDSRTELICSRGSTPASVVAELPELISQNPMLPSPTAPPERAKGKRAFMLPPRPQHGSTRSKPGLSRHADAGVNAAAARGDTLMPSGGFSMPRPWSWKNKRS